MTGAILSPAHPLAGPLRCGGARDYRIPRLVLERAKESIVRKMMGLLAGVAVMVGGCATYNPDPKLSDIDYGKVARIESAAKAYGVTVYWVNYPTKSSASVN